MRRQTRLGEAHVRPPRASLPEAATAIRRSFWALTLPPFVLLGMYFGVFTATEAAGMGALWALIIATVIYRKMSPADLWQCGRDAARTSAMLFMIIVSAGLFGLMLTKLGIPDELLRLALRHDVGQFGFLAAIMVVLFVLGLVLESISIILITTPVVLPVLEALGIDRVWYGVLLTINLELALMSPPVAMNLVVIKSITKAPLAEINRAAVPYMVLLALGIVAILIFPEIALWLPRSMELGR
jgi:C4-dicarboxylate transporter DctM subunit